MGHDIANEAHDVTMTNDIALPYITMHEITRTLI